MASMIVANHSAVFIPKPRYHWQRWLWYEDVSLVKHPLFTTADIVPLPKSNLDDAESRRFLWNVILILWCWGYGALLALASMVTRTGNFLLLCYVCYWGLDSLDAGRCGCNPELIIFKLISEIDIICVSWHHMASLGHNNWTHRTLEDLVVILNV